MANQTSKSFKIRNVTKSFWQTFCRNDDFFIRYQNTSRHKISRFKLLRLVFRGFKQPHTGCELSDVFSARRYVSIASARKVENASAKAVETSQIK